MNIDIKVDDLNLFAKVAFVLDRKELLEDIIEIRKCWKLDEKLIAYNDFRKWINSPRYDFSLTKSAARLFYDAKDRLETGQNLRQFDDLTFLQRDKEFAYLNPMDYEIEYLLRKHKIKVNWKNILLKAIVCGEVRRDDYDSIDKDFSYGDWLFNEASFDYSLEKVYSSDSKPEIKRDREWHWLKEKGKTYLEIAEETPYKGKIDPADFVDNIKKQIRRYKEFLAGGHLKTS